MPQRERTPQQRQRCSADLPTLRSPCARLCLRPPYQNMLLELQYGKARVQKTLLRGGHLCTRAAASRPPALAPSTAMRPALLTPATPGRTVTVCVLCTASCTPAWLHSSDSAGVRKLCPGQAGTELVLVTVDRHLNVSTRCLHVQLGCCVVLATCGDQVIEAGLQVVNRLALVEAAPCGMPPAQHSAPTLLCGCCCCCCC